MSNSDYNQGQQIKVSRNLSMRTRTKQPSVASGNIKPKPGTSKPKLSQSTRKVRRNNTYLLRSLLNDYVLKTNNYQQYSHSCFYIEENISFFICIDKNHYMQID